MPHNVQHNFVSSHTHPIAHLFYMLKLHFRCNAHRSNYFNHLGIFNVHRNVTHMGLFFTSTTKRAAADGNQTHDVVIGSSSL